MSEAGLMRALQVSPSAPRSGKGVIRNAVTQFLWSEAMLAWVKDRGRKRSGVDACPWMHLNFS
jgi:hypothetical protein